MKNILKNSPVLKRVHVDNKFFNTLLSRHHNHFGKLQKKFRFFSANTFDKAVFLQKYHRRKKSVINKSKRYLHVPFSIKMLDLSVRSNEKTAMASFPYLGLKQLKKKRVKEQYLEKDIKNISLIGDDLEYEERSSFIEEKLYPIINQKVAKKSVQKLDFSKVFLNPKYSNQRVISKLLEKQKSLKLEKKVKNQEEQTTQRLAEFGFKQLKKKPLEKGFSQLKNTSQKFLESATFAPKVARLKPSIPRVSNSLLIPIKFKKNQERKYKKELERLSKEVRSSRSQSLNQSVVKNLLVKQQTFNVNKKVETQKEQNQQRLVEFGFKQLKKKHLDKNSSKEDFDVNRQEKSFQLKNTPQKFLELEIFVPKTARLKPSIPNLSNSLLVPIKFKKNQERKYKKELERLNKEVRSGRSQSLNQSVVQNLLEKQKIFKVNKKVEIQEEQNRQRLAEFGFKQLKKQDFEVDGQEKSFAQIDILQNSLESEALAPNKTRLNPSIPRVSNSLLVPVKFKKSQEHQYKKELERLNKEVRSSRSQSLNQSVVQKLLAKQKILKIEEKVKKQEKQNPQRLAEFGFKQLKQKRLNEHTNEKFSKEEKNFFELKNIPQKFLASEIFVPKTARLKPSILNVSNSLLVPVKFKRSQERKYKKELERLTKELKNSSSDSLNQRVIKNILAKQKSLKIEEKLKNQENQTKQRLAEFGFKQLKKRDSKESLKEELFKEDFNLDGQEKHFAQIDILKNSLESEALAPNKTRLKPSIPNVSNSLLVPVKFKKNQERKYKKELERLTKELKNSSSDSLNQRVIKNILAKQKSLKIEEKLKNQENQTKQRLAEFGFKQLKKRDSKESLKEELFKEDFNLDGQEKHFAQIDILKNSLESEALAQNKTRLKPSIPNVFNSLLVPIKFKKSQERKYKKELERLTKELKNSSSDSLNQRVIKNILAKQKSLKIEEKLKNQENQTKQRLAEFGFKQLKKIETKKNNLLDKREDRLLSKQEPVDNTRLRVNKNRLTHYKDFLLSRQYLKVNNFDNSSFDENVSLEFPLYGFESTQSNSTIFVDFMKRAKKLDSRIESLENSIFQSQGGIREQQSALSNGLTMNLSQPQSQKREEEVKYARTDRHETTETTTPNNSVINQAESASTVSPTDDLEELSMKMFQRLKSDIALEYTRAGR